MTKNKQYASAVCVAVSLVVATAMPAFAQQSTDSTSTTRQMSGSGPSGSLEQYSGAFRASELVGATVYNEQGNSVGKVNDVLIDTAGKADKVVISVGGFLGIDSKYVDVNFGELKIEPSHRSSIDTTATTTTPSTTAASNSSGTATRPARNTSEMTATSPTNTPSPSNVSKYYSLVMPGATKDSLAKMPEFKYSS